MSNTPLSSAETIKLFDRYVVPNYNRFPGFAGTRGEGSYVWDGEGNRYLDLFCGWGCNLLGHCPGPVIEAVREQLGTMLHVPNTWYTEVQGRWARGPLSTRSFGGQAFFCNSGTEANEAAIKLARLARLGEESATRSSPSKAVSTAERSARRPPPRSRSIMRGSGRSWPVSSMLRSAIWTPSRN